MAGGEKLKVFISYSRKDSAEFADELLVGLQLAGFAPFLDRHDIAPGEDWEIRLDGLIQAADTVVFVVSPEAVKSERCAWESERTLALSKRLLPVIFKPVPETDIPHELRRLQFVRFDIGAGLARPLLQLAEALSQDVDWVREHTRLGELASRWQARRRPDSLLLRGDDHDSAKAWLRRRSAGAPEITDLQRTFIDASEKAEVARIAELRVARGRTRRMQALVSVLVAAMGLGLIAWRYEQPLKEGIYWLGAVHALTEAQTRALKPKGSFQECANCPAMIVVPAGTFLMGSPGSEGSLDEHPQHKVWLFNSFAVGKFELTFDEWDACAAFGDCDASIRASSLGRDRHPAINITWDDAQRYVRWLSRLIGQPYRLLTEAEWEYAARAGSTSAYSFGDNEAMLGQYAWYDNMSGGDKALAVGEKQPNAFGLYDMHGNVWEWVQDCYYDSYHGADLNGSRARLTGDCGRRVVRGGSFLDLSDRLRSAARYMYSPGNRARFLGFRVARTLTP